jgi:hypothetical protein
MATKTHAHVAKMISFNIIRSELALGLTISSLAGLQGALADGDGLLDGLGGLRTIVGQIEHDLRLLNLGVVHGNPSTLGQEMVDEVDSGRLSSVTGVGLEGEPEDGDLLAGDRVEQGVDDLFGEPVLLVVVGLDDGVPVSSDLLEVELCILTRMPMSTSNSFVARQTARRLTDRAR